jgi:molybdopterin-guanine dinucleotide biosynthesis protein A
MGRDKASLVIGGKTLAQRAVDTLRQVCREVFTVGGASGFSNALHLPDIEPPFTVEGRAAMTGIYTALRSCRAEFAAVLACDMPNVTAEVLQIMIEKIENEPRCHAVIPRDADGREQTLCTILRRDPCLAAIDRSQHGRTPSVRDMLAQLNTTVIEFAEVAHLGEPKKLFANLNTPEDISASG